MSLKKMSLRLMVLGFVLVTLATPAWAGPSRSVELPVSALSSWIGDIWSATLGWLGIATTDGDAAPATMDSDQAADGSFPVAPRSGSCIDPHGVPIVPCVENP